MAPKKTKATAAPLMGDVLVTGGCGFFGYHLVSQLLSDPECRSVTVLDRNTSINLHPGATYVSGSVTDAPSVRSLLADLKPRTIFHAASPSATFRTPGIASMSGDMRDTNVVGTQVLLSAAAECGSVRAFVFTSTIDVFAGPPHEDVDETHSVWGEGEGKEEKGSDEYGRSKARASRLVAAANQPRMKTVNLMLAHMYGERDSQGLRVVLDAVDVFPRSWPMVQIGPGRNEVEVLSASNAALAHRLAAKALLDPSRAAGGRVDGEDFIVSDGDRVVFWHHMRVMWRAARGIPDGGEVRTVVVPGWFMLAIAWVVGWAVWVFSLGRGEVPTQLGPAAMSYSLESHTYDTRKARERLGFSPVADHDGEVARAVRWELRRREEVGRKAKGE